MTYPRVASPLDNISPPLEKIDSPTSPILIPPTTTSSLLVSLVYRISSLGLLVLSRLIPPSYMDKPPQTPTPVQHSLRSYLGFHSGLHTHLTSLILSDLSCIVYPRPLHQPCRAPIPHHAPQFKVYPFEQQETWTAEALGLSLAYTFGTFSLRLMHFVHPLSYHLPFHVWVRSGTFRTSTL